MNMTERKIYYLGIDGGGSRTTAAVADKDGNVILRATGESINFYSVGMEAARKNLSDVINKVYASIGETKFYAAFIGCSALDDEADKETVDALCGGIIDADYLAMSSDVHVALTASGSNCVAICGTGSMAVGEKADGSIAVTGGWGHIIGDEGSAYSIAVKALRECCGMRDRNERTPLIESAEEFFEVDDFRKAIDKIYSENTAKDYIARFAKNVAELSDKGCAVSKQILCDEAAAFAKTVAALLDEIGGSPMLSLYGGVFQHNAFFRDEFMKNVRIYHPHQASEILDVSPEEGAIKAARLLPCKNTMNT